MGVGTGRAGKAIPFSKHIVSSKPIACREHSIIHIKFYVFTAGVNAEPAGYKASFPLGSSDVETDPCVDR